MVGASAGSLAATLAATGVDPEKTLECAYRLGKEYGIWERPLGERGSTCSLTHMRISFLLTVCLLIAALETGQEPEVLVCSGQFSQCTVSVVACFLVEGLMGIWGQIVREWLDELLPEDAGVLCRWDSLADAFADGAWSPSCWKCWWPSAVTLFLSLWLHLGNWIQCCTVAHICPYVFCREQLTESHWPPLSNKHKDWPELLQDIRKKSENANATVCCWWMNSYV